MTESGYCFKNSWYASLFIQQALKNWSRAGYSEGGSQRTYSLRGCSNSSEESHHCIIHPSTKSVKEITLPKWNIYFQELYDPQSLWPSMLPPAKKKKSTHLKELKYACKELGNVLVYNIDKASKNASYYWPRIYTIIFLKIQWNWITHWC